MQTEAEFSVIQDLIGSNKDRGLTLQLTPWTLHAMSLRKARLGIYPDLTQRSLQNLECLWWAALKLAPKRLPTLRVPPARSPLCFFRPFNYHFEHSIFGKLLCFVWLFRSSQMAPTVGNKKQMRKRKSFTEKHLF